MSISGKKNYQKFAKVSGYTNNIYRSLCEEGCIISLFWSINKNKTFFNSPNILILK